MAKVEIYTTPTCPYCMAAKALLARKGVAYQETDVSRDPDLRAAMAETDPAELGVPTWALEGVRRAEPNRRLEGLLAPTPLTESSRLSAKYGATVVLKREDQQPVRSYKIRGASNLISQLDDDARAPGASRTCVTRCDVM